MADTAVEGDGTDPSGVRRAAVCVADGGLACQVASWLAEEGFRCETHASNDVFLEALVAGEPPPELIVAQAKAVGVDGWRLCCLLRSPEFPQGGQIPILLVDPSPGMADTRWIAKRLERVSGFGPPWDAAGFHRALRRVLGTSQVRLGRMEVVEAGLPAPAGLVSALESEGFEVVRTQWPNVPHPQPGEGRVRVLCAPSADHAALEGASAEGIPWVAVLGRVGPKEALRALRLGASAVFPIDRPPVLVASACGDAWERGWLSPAGRIPFAVDRWFGTAGFFEWLVDTSNEGVWVMDANHRTVYVNPAMAAMLGYEPAEMVGRQVEDFFFPEDLSFHRERMALRHSGVDEVYERRFRTREGGELWTLTSARAIVDAQGRFQGSFAMFEDITARKRAERELAESERRFRRLVETSPEGMFVAKGGRLLYVNPAFRKLVGLPCDAAPEATRLEDLVPPDSATLVLPLLELAERSVAPTVETMVQTLDGATVEVELRATPIPYQGEACALGVLRDVAEQRRMERGFVALGTDLARFSGERFYVAATNVLAEALEVCGAFVARLDPGLQRMTVIGSGGAVRLEGQVCLEGTALRESLQSGRLPEARWVEMGPEDRLASGGARFLLAVPLVGDDGAAFGVLGALAERRPANELFARRLVAVFAERIGMEVRRAEAEAARRRAEEQVRLLFDRQKLGMAVSDPETRWIQVNDSLCSMLGFSREELLERSWQELTHPEDLAREEPLHEALLRGEIEEYAIEKRHRRKDGNLLPTKATVVSSREAGRVQYLLAVIEDLTEAKRLARERETLLQSFEQAGEAIVITDIEGRIEHVNPAFERTSGYTRKEVVGCTPAILKSGRHDAAFYGQLWSTILSGEVWRGRLVNRRKDGSLYTEEATIAPVRSEDGRITHFVAVKRDVTRELELQAHVAHTSRMESIGRLAGGLAHDFNNMLGVILGQAALALEMAADGDPVADHLREIVKAAERSASLTRKLLAFSRRQVVESSVIDLNQAVEDSLRMVRPMLRESIRLEWKPSEEAGCVRMEPGQVDQILLNLIANARDAVGEQGRILVETGVPAASNTGGVLAGVCPEGPATMLVVEDDGCGMDSLTQEHLFEPFFTTKSPGDGTGLGLTTVYAIVRQHGGCIRVRSEKGRGSRFEVILPRLEHEGQAPSASPSSRLLGTESILVVEDEPAMRTVLECTLTGLGYRVRCAESADAAWEALATEREAPDLVLSDVVMPGMSGVELAERIQERFPALPVLLMSGYAEEASLTREATAKRFLAKPFSPEELAAKVREVLSDAARRELKVLMIDDDDLYVPLVARFLSKAGHRLLSAESSHQALEALRGEKVDLLLVDLHLAGEDGYSAIRRIRAQGFDPPAVIQTGDRFGVDERALAGLGVVDVVEKTADGAKLVETVERAARSVVWRRR